tara:strand:- start:854 stop:3154 length:2301 start_codon:yes stop_codon:yes gene_type:complete
LLPVLYPRLPPRIFFVNADPDRLNLIELINKANATIDLDEAVDILLPALGGSRAELREKLKATGKWVAREDLDDSSPGDAVNDVTDVINDGIDNAGQVVDELDQIIGDYVQDAIDDIVGTINDATGGIVGEVLEGIGRGSDIITNVLDGIEGIISDSRGVLDDIFRIVSGRVDLEITNVINIPTDIFEVIVGGIGDILEDERRRMEGVLGIVVDGITGIFSDVIEEQARSTITIATSIDEQTQVQEESADELLDEVKEINNETIDGTGASMAKGVGLVMEEAVNRSDVGVPQDWVKGFDLDRLKDCSEATLDDWIKEKGLIDGVGGSIAFAVMQVVGKTMGLLSIGGALSAKELYEFSRSCAWEILEPGDAVVAYQRGLISLDNLNDELRMRGYSQTRVDTLIETGYQVPDPASLYSMNLRGLPGGENLTDRFKDLGFNPTDAQSLSDLKFYIPGAQDLITMAVRDVFNPAIVEEFGQDQDFPEEFGKYAAQQGISDFWARKYWAAHWVLPSMQMGFEMLHRRVIDEDKLKRLMAAQDIMPGWRDDLIAISYRPYTRVDIRRMHDTGVLSEDEVYDAYRDIGYNDERARTLTDFTIELNRDDPDPLEPLDGLTRSAVISAYKDGLIDRITAEGLLEAEGVGPDARLIYLNDAELDIEKELRNDQSQTLLIEYENAAISLREAVIALRALPLTPLENEKVELKLRRITAKRTKLPSKADLQKMYKNSVIGKGTFKDQMERLGYPDKWIEDYIKLVKLGITVDDEPTT